MAEQNPTATNGSAAKQMTCFVVTGFGLKTDYATGRVLNLDKTYEQLIRPAFDKVNVNAFRAIDANVTGSIDSLMYQWIYAADIVIADLSTLNANVFYELGVRHAQRPNTTIIIAESVLMSKIPFDLSSFVIHQYEHGGEEIAEAEQDRFVDYMAGVLRKIIDTETQRQSEAADQQRQGDSPVFQFLTGMEEPEYTFKEFLAPPVYIPPDQRAAQPVEEGESLASIIAAAEAAKNDKNFEEAIRLFRNAIGNQEKPDLFLAQRLALVTYKHGEARDEAGNMNAAAAEKALLDAEEILEKYCAPKISTDPETLGLSGAINKRLYELTDDIAYLDKAIRFYERGFYVKQDYYNGINVAFMYTERSLLMDNQFDAIVSYGHANIIREKVTEVCQDIMDAPDFQSRGDKEWVYATMAEAKHGMGMAEDTDLMRRIDREASDFAKESYGQQKAKLQDAMDEFEQRFGLGKDAAAVPAEPVPMTASLVETRDVEEQPRAARVDQNGAIIIDANIGRTPIRSVELNCKIEYN